MTLVVPETLKEKIRQNKLVPLIGAGVSMSVLNDKGERVFPSWPELLQCVAKKLEAEGKKNEGDVVNGLVCMKRLGDAARIAKDSLDSALWYEFLEEQFQVTFSDLDLDSADLHRAIWKFNSRIITLNYDNCMMWAHSSPCDIISFDNNDLTCLRNFKASRIQKDMIWHLHGKISSPEHIVLTPESYEHLYNDNIQGEKSYEAAISTLRDIISSESLLFIGCSMSDIDLLVEMGKQNKLFSGNTGPHYALVKESDSDEVQLKLENAGIDIQLLYFSDFGKPLVAAVNQLSHYRENDRAQKKNTDTKQQIVETEVNDRVVIYESNPLDKPQSYDLIHKTLKKFKSTLQYKTCNIENLYDDTDYAVIISRWTPNGFLIEDDNACSDYLDLENIVDCMPFGLKGLIVLTDKIPEKFNKSEFEEKVDTPIVLLEVIDIKHDLVKKFEQIYHQLFKKKNLGFFPNSVVINGDDFSLDLKSDGKNVLIKEDASVLKEIDKSSVVNFVGRKSDLSSLSRELSRVEDKIQALTVKGSGGVGKTTIVKKLAIELANRGKYPGGITFIDCEPITEYKIFNHKVSYAFDLHSIDDLIDYLRKNNDLEARLIILDNFESILNLPGESGRITRERCKNLVGIISEYASFIITSRELLGEPWEEEYTLRSLESDEAILLFNKITKNRFSTVEEQRFLKVEILEKLLDRNPLAINLVASSLPPGTKLSELKVELEEELFEIAKSSFFDDAVDYNINRQESLLASILYSYNTLTVGEIRALELISFFPDGINLTTFKKIVKNSYSKSESKKIKQPITDKDIKSLSDKSLLESDKGRIKLQSIVNRYALNNVGEDKDISSYWKEVTKYSLEMMDYAVSLNLDEDPLAFEILLSNVNNIMLSVDLGYNVLGEHFSTDEYLEFLKHIDSMGSFINLCDIYSSKIYILIQKAKKSTLGRDFVRTLELLQISSLYFKGDFDIALEKLYKTLPLNEISMLDMSNKADRYSCLIAVNIYRMEGYNRETLKIQIDMNLYQNLAYDQELYELGLIYPEMLERCHRRLGYFEVLKTMGEDYRDELKDIISNLHDSECLNKCQLMYLLHQVEPVSEKEIKKLVSVNPFTRGLKKLMLAYLFGLNIDKSNYLDVEKITKLFDSALNDLFHIKYYYVQAIYYYAHFLKKIEYNEAYLELYELGVELSNGFSFELLKHEFKRLNDLELAPFDYNNVPLPEGMDPSNFVRKKCQFMRKYKSLNKLRR